jgi:abnormal spindle-like microcephaly-associated protein
MLRRLSATPCPTGEPQHNDGRRDSILSTINDSTTDLEYTTQFKTLFQNTKPKRRPTAIGKTHAPALGFTIHEDEELKLEETPEPATLVRASIGLPLRRSVISQPAQRPKHRVSFVPPPRDQQSDVPQQPPRSTSAKAPRRLSLYGGMSNLPPPVPEDHTLPQVSSPKISKPARRGTIYIPTDDTTMPSMYMGIFSPLKMGISEATKDEAADMTGLAAQMARKKTSRKSILAASPKRAPLVSNNKPLQAPKNPEIRRGQGPGKENAPPGSAIISQQLAGRKAKKSLAIIHEHPRRVSVSPRPSSRLFEQTASTSARSKTEAKAPKPVSRPVWNAGSRMPQVQPVKLNQNRAPQTCSASKRVIDRPPAACVPTRFVVPNVTAEPVLDKYPLIPEGLSDTSMYEESWLAQQEVAITQLVNNLFSAASPTFAQDHDDDLLRLYLLELYGSSEMGLLYKRLQGALLYGALSITKDTLESGRRLISDLGHRRAFINLWLGTYDHHILRTALEVIVGRLVRRTPSHGSNNSHPTSPATIDRRALQRAIETFLIRNEDGDPDPETTSPDLWNFQRTMLRSLMLIKLLDASKINDDLPPTANLFQTSAVHKTSVSVLQQLMRMLNSGVGDAIRPLSHLGFSINHIQYPLEEYNYKIQNLAVDLRDGVRLTRVVELLLYRSASHRLEHLHDADGETLSLTDGHQDWPLSQHLKFPCLSRATKLFNCQIALTALQSVKGASALFHDISAKDIVDGYREKTVRLLWALTSKWGLGGLVDWDDLKKEIRRLGRCQGKVGDWFVHDLDYDDEETGHMRYKTLLKAWVKAVAGAHALAVRNFTTSFADGRIFQAIVDEYQPYLAGAESVDSKGSLTSILKNLGCSEQLVRFFEKAPGRVSEHIFDRDFVLASLAFLCSRLLGPSRRARAAVVIQRGWRRRWDVVLKQRTSVLCTLATSCALRVQHNRSKARAKAVIWRTWKAFKARGTGGVGSQSAPEGVVSNRLKALSLQDSSGGDDDIWLSLR